MPKALKDIPHVDLYDKCGHWRGIIDARLVDEIRSLGFDMPDGPGSAEIFDEWERSQLSVPVVTLSDSQKARLDSLSVDEQNRLDAMLASTMRFVEASND